MWGKCKTWIIPTVCLLVGFGIGALLFGQPVDVVCAAIEATYEVEGLPLAMEDGQNLYRQSDTDQSAILTYLDRIPVRGKLSGDKDGAAVTLTQLPGNGCVYTYVAAALPEGRGVKGTNAVLLGDRITILDVTIAEEIIWVSMLTHKEGDLPENPPEVPETRQFFYRDGQLVQLP